MLKHISLLSAAALAATLSGLVREATLAYVFGTSQYADATATAIFLHDTIAAAFITGGFGFAVMPLIARQRAAGGDVAAVRLVTATTVWVALVASLAALIAFPIIPSVVQLAMRDDPERAATMAGVLRSALPALAILTVASAIAAFLPAFDRFHQPSVARLLWNVGISAGLLLVSWLGAPTGIAVALVAGAVANLLVVMLPLPGREHQAVILSHPGLRDLARLAAPSLFVIAGINASLGIWERYLLARVGEGSIATVNYAQRASYMASTVSTAVAVVAFTEMTRHATNGTMAPAGVETIRKVARRYLMLLIPLMCFMIVSRREIIALLFARGAFNATAVWRTAAAFGAYATAVLPVFLLSLFVRALFTLDRPWIAMAVLGAGAGVSALLDGLFVARLGELAIPIGYAGGVLTGAVIAVWLVERHVQGGLASSVWQGVGLGTLLGAAGLGLHALLMRVPPFRTSCTAVGLGGVTCLSGRLLVGLVAFVLAATTVGYVIHLEEMERPRQWLRRKLDGSAPR